MRDVGEGVWGRYWEGVGEINKEGVGEGVEDAFGRGGDWAGANTAYSTLICKVLCSSINH